MEITAEPTTYIAQFGVLWNEVLADRSSQIAYEFNPYHIMVDHNIALFCGVKEVFGQNNMLLIK